MVRVPPIRSLAFEKTDFEKSLGTFNLSEFHYEFSIFLFRDSGCELRSIMIDFEQIRLENSSRNRLQIYSELYEDTSS